MSGPPSFAGAALRIAGPLGVLAQADAEAGARALTNELSKAGAGPGVVVGHSFGLEPVAVVALQAIARAQAILAPIHPEWSDRERDAFVRAVAPRLVLMSSGASWAGTEWTRRSVSLPGLAEVTLWERSGPGSTPTESPPTTAGAEGGVLLGTSGTGGAPKFVCHGWRSLWANAEAANERLCFGADGAWLATLAWAHVGGLAVALRAAASGGALIFGPPRFAAEEIAGALETQGVSHVSIVPAMLHRLLELGRGAPPALRVALLGGAAAPPTLIQRALAAGWPVALTYGLTEAGSQVATATPDEVARHPEAVGFALRGMEIQIGSPAAAAGLDGDSGEIEVRGPTLFGGYLGKAPRDPKTWFATGDLGRFDGQGRLSIVGRLSDRILTGGANVDPVEVEAVLVGHPDVREAVVLGLPDDVFGEVVTAVIVGEGEDLAARLAPWARERLSGPRAPRRWKVLQRMPRTATGKVDRARLRILIATNQEESP